jgi:hypothetical protein
MSKPDKSRPAFLGAQPQFTPEDIQSTEAFTREGVVGLQTRSRGRAGG